MERLVQACFGITALVNLLPVVGVASAARLEALYGVGIGGDPNLEILLRHRALLFGVAGGLLFAAVFRRSLRLPAALAGLGSMLGFLLVVWMVGDANPELRRVAAVDGVATLVLLAGAALETRRR